MQIIKRFFDFFSSKKNESNSLKLTQTTPTEFYIMGFNSYVYNVLTNKVYREETIIQDSKSVKRRYVRREIKRNPQGYFVIKNNEGRLQKLSIEKILKLINY
jgi:predicted lipase